MLNLKKGNFTYSICVIDNADCGETRDVVLEFKEKLPIEFLVEKNRGKNNALNKALQHVAAAYYVFTDDDVLVDPEWLFEIAEGVKRWDSTCVFGGKILPSYPDGSEMMLKKLPLSSDYIKYAFCIADWGPEQIINPMCVWGANLVIKSSVFDGSVSFNEKVGPMGADYIMGSETELIGRLYSMGHKPVYLPNATVFHLIRPEQLTMGWLRKRAIRSGRGEAFRQGVPKVPYMFGVPRFLYKKVAIKFMQVAMKKVFVSREAAFDEEMCLFELFGAMQHYKRMGR